ncbi:MAG: DNA gyrase subunit A [bacterium]
MQNNEEVVHDRIKEVNIASEMKTSFLNYAMSVIVSRALPDIRDGLKPVQRRILFGMNELHIYANSAYKKSARIVGEVMGKYHPHGDSSIYEAMVRMAQPFSYRYMLVDGHGNFGSVDGDGAAAMRYTEARMSKISMEMLRDLDKNTVDYVDNYDGSETEPSVLPGKIPNLLVNGSTGIAVGMATNIPPHNLREVIDGILALMDNKDITTDELMNFVKGPDFPTGGQILGLTGLRNAYNTGNGIIVVRAKAEIIEQKNGKPMIVVSEIPYQVNKSKLIDRIAEVVNLKIIDGITDLRDESNRNGMRIVIELRRDCNAHVILNQLYKFTQLQQSFGMNMIALVNNKPQTITLKLALEEYLKHQLVIITRRTEYDLEKARAKHHILEGLVIALNNIDEVIEIIKSSPNGEEARIKLMTRFDLSEIQAREILNTRLQRLTSIEVDKVIKECEEIQLFIEELLAILASEDLKLSIIRDELTEISRKFGDDRKSEISLSADLDIEDEDLIPQQEVIITVTNKGYAKRIPVEQYKAQNRGGRGLTGMKTNEDDEVQHLVLTSTHDFLLFFTNTGRVYKVKAYQIMEGSRISKGIPLVNVLGLQKDEKLMALCSVNNFDDEKTNLLFATRKAIVKRTPIKLFKNIRANGIIAINLNEGDELLGVIKSTGDKDIILGASNGKSIRFPESDMRDISRQAIGVRGMKLPEGDYLVGMGIVSSDEDEILVLTEKGFGKRSKAEEYRCQGRGGSGSKALNVTAKNGNLACLKVVTDADDLIATTDKGMVMRTHVANISQTGRATQGVIVIRLNDGHQLSNVAIVPREDTEEELLEQLENTEATVVEAVEVKEEVTAE